MTTKRLVPQVFFHMTPHAPRRISHPCYHMLPGAAALSPVLDCNGWPVKLTLDAGHFSWGPVDLRTECFPLPLNLPSLITKHVAGVFCYWYKMVAFWGYVVCTLYGVCTWCVVLMQGAPRWAWWKQPCMLHCRMCASCNALC